MSGCQYGQENCKNEDVKCQLCIDSYHYLAKKSRPKGLSSKAMKADKRTGSQFEYANYTRDKNNLVNDVSTRLTPNSGAGYVKGDNEINGIITIMKEMKTKVKEQAPGKETFTIQKKWLTKLNREANAAGKEFWFLNFNFNQPDSDIYTIIETDQIDSMVKTMVKDRQAANVAAAKINLAEKQRREFEAKLIASQAEIDTLNAKIKLLEELQNGTKSQM